MSGPADVEIGVENFNRFFYTNPEGAYRSYGPEIPLRAFATALMVGFNNQHDNRITINGSPLYLHALSQSRPLYELTADALRDICYNYTIPLKSLVVICAKPEIDNFAGAMKIPVESAASPYSRLTTNTAAVYFLQFYVRKAFATYTRTFNEQIYLSC